MQDSQGAVGGAVQENIPLGLLPGDMEAISGNIPLGSLPIGQGKHNDNLLRQIQLSSEEECIVEFEKKGQCSRTDSDSGKGNSIGVSDISVSIFLRIGKGVWVP